jgi:hypothetical protein
MYTDGVWHTAPLALPLAAAVLCLSCETTEDALGRNTGEPDGGPDARPNPVLSVEGSDFLLDGMTTQLWGIRVASAGMSEALTEHLIAQLDDYARHGVNSIAVFYQGSSGGQFDPFAPDGTDIDDAHQARMERIIEACAERDMVVIVGIFYSEVEPVLADWAASVEAVRTVAQRLVVYDNVIINVANQQNAESYSARPWSQVQDLAGLEELFRAVHEVDPTRIVGSGGYDPESNVEIGLSAEADVLLFSGGELADRMTTFGDRGISDKPIVCVELYGADTEAYTPAGVFSDATKARYFADADTGLSDPALSVFFHATPWTQIPSEASGLLRYDLAGAGTEADPGIRWYFEYVAELLGLVP